MQPLSYYLGVSKQTEVLLLTLIGICCTIFDASLLDLNSNLHKVWEVALDPMQVSGKSQMYLKYILSGVILVRSFSVHLYLAFYIVMLWPAIFEERPGLLLPWLIVGAIKCLGMGLISLCTGMFTCFACGVYRPACLDFAIAQIIDHTPSFYMWFCVLSYYRELKMCATIITYEKSKTDLETEITIRRRKVRSMADNIALKHHCPIDEERHLISVSTIENIVQQLTTDLHRKTTRSLDSLLGVMVAEAEKEELMNLCDDLPSEEIDLTIQEKTAKLLKLTKQDIIAAQNRKKLGKGMVFTFSMLDMQDTSLDEVHTAKKVSNLTKATYRTLSLPADNLRITKSEKGNITPSDFSKYGTTTEFMSNISETEIGSVLNYSSISLATKNEQEIISQPSLVSSQISYAQEVELSENHDNIEVLEEQFEIKEQKTAKSKITRKDEHQIISELLLLPSNITYTQVVELSENQDNIEVLKEQSEIKEQQTAKSQIAKEDEQQITSEPFLLSSDITYTQEVELLENHDNIEVLEEQSEIKEQEAKSKIARNYEQEITSQPSLLPSEITYSQEVELSENQANIEVLEEQSEIKGQQKGILSKTSDVGCQASTLSRSILKSPFQLQRCIKDRPVPTSKKTSPRTPLTKPSGQDAARVKKDNSKLEGKYKKVIRKEVREIMPVKVEIPKNTSSFKTDGYTMAYNEKMRTN